MNNKNVMCVALVTVIVLLAGCGPRDTRSFPRLKQQRAAHVVQDGVTISVHLLSRQDCVAYFDFDVIAKGYRPLLLTIENGTADAYVLRPSYFELARVSGKEISRFMHYDTYQRMVWLSMPAFIYIWQLIPILIVPYGLGCRHYNQKTTRNIRKKTLGRDDIVTIAAYEIVQRFVFVPEESFKTIFDIKLFNETTGKVENFKINCAEPLLKKV